MAHDIIIILDVIDTIIGTGCTWTPMMDLRVAVLDAEEYLTTSEQDPDPIRDALHEKLEELEEFLVTGQDMKDGLVGTILNYTDTISNLLN